MKKIVVVAALSLTACASRQLEPEEVPVELPLGRPGESASLWNQDPESLFGNRRARVVGDLLTVLVEINDQAEILNDNQRNRQSERTIEIPAALGLPQWADGALPGGATLSPAVDISSAEQTRGLGQLRRQDRVTLRLAARVKDRLPNGDLVIEGNQSVQVGNDRRQLLVSGIVRPEDISRQNTV